MVTSYCCHISQCLIKQKLHTVSLKETPDRHKLFLNVLPSWLNAQCMFYLLHTCQRSEPACLWLVQKVDWTIDILLNLSERKILHFVQIQTDSIFHTCFSTNWTIYTRGNKPWILKPIRNIEKESVYFPFFLWPPSLCLCLSLRHVASFLSFFLLFQNNTFSILPSPNLP